MNGEFNFRKFSNFIKSFWGILASFTIILPSLIFFLKAKQIQESVLNDYYIGVPTTFALLVIPFVFLFEDKLSSLITARRVSIIFVSLSVITLFSFLIVKNVFVVDTYYSVPAKQDYGRIEFKEASSGKIEIVTFNAIGEAPIKAEIRVNILEMVSLALYSFSIIFLTISFSGLGVFFYTRSNK